MAGSDRRGAAFRNLLRAIFALYAAYLYFAVCGSGSRFSFMLLNTFLAYVPVELSFHLRGIRRGAFFWPLFAAWFFFYPNAPYVLTDFFHLAKVDPYRDGSTGLMRPDARLWLDFTTVAFGAVLCPLAGTWCLRRALAAMLGRFGPSGARFMAPAAAATMAAASFGMYLGRFPRLHTVHLVTAPLAVAGAALEPGAGMVEFTVLMTLLQGLFWIMASPAATRAGD